MLTGDVNADTKRLFKGRLKVRSTPSFLLFRDGAPAGSLVGANREKLEALLRASLPPEGLPPPIFPAAT
jgi:thioredoxin-like negative regulator of GroEL